jgi:hypothetical protein
MIAQAPTFLLERSRIVWKDCTAIVRTACDRCKQLLKSVAVVVEIVPWDDLIWRLFAVETFFLFWIDMDLGECEYEGVYKTSREIYCNDVEEKGTSVLRAAVRNRMDGSSMRETDRLIDGCWCISCFFPLFHFASFARALFWNNIAWCSEFLTVCCLWPFLMGTYPPARRRRRLTKYIATMRTGQILVLCK